MSPATFVISLIIILIAVPLFCWFVWKAILPEALKTWLYNYRERLAVLGVVFLTIILPGLAYLILGVWFGTFETDQTPKILMWIGIAVVAIGIILSFFSWIICQYILRPQNDQTQAEIKPSNNKQLN